MFRLRYPSSEPVVGFRLAKYLRDEPLTVVKYPPVSTWLPQTSSVWTCLLAACLKVGSTAPLVVLILARFCTAVPLTAVKLPPMYAWLQSLPANAIELTVPFTDGAQGVSVNGAVAPKLKRFVQENVLPFSVSLLTLPTAYIVEQHWTSWRIC